MVVVSEAPVGIEELLAVARGAEVELDDAARAAIAASRAVVDEVLASGRPVYGVNTGVGHQHDVRMPDDQLRQLQRWLVASHASGIGPPLPTLVVRAALAARLVGLTRGGSGASPAVAEVIAAMLNAGVHPVVPALGSLGAGDLGQMATMALVATGAGTAELRGATIHGAEALRRAGIAPLVLEPKDGLAFLSSNAVVIGHAALVVERAARAAARADAVAAVAMEAARANPSVIAPAVGRAKPFPGQVAACAHLSELLAGSDLLAEDGARAIQDPLSFRVVPQVHGALREVVAWVRAAVETELNGQGDNPLVDVEARAIVHNGNFHPMVLAIAVDALRVALAHLGQLSDRRMSHLWAAFFAGVTGPPPLDGGVPELPGLALRYPAAAVAAELRQLAGPVTLDVGPLDLGVEDHHTSAPLSVRRADAALDVLDDVLTAEALLARDVVLTVHPGARLGRGPAATLRTIDDALAATADRTPAALHRAVRTALAGPDDR